MSMKPVTYEYPPSFARHRPLSLDPNNGHHGMLRFQHHFFLTRLKIITKSVLWSPNIQIEELRRLNDEVRNVLTSFGHCVALGVVVHAPFFLQKMLLGPYLEVEALKELRGAFSDILHSITVSDRDKAFAEDICPNSSGWWNVGRACDYKSLSNLATAKLEQLRIEGVFSPDEYISLDDLEKIYDRSWQRTDDGSDTKAKSPKAPQTPNPPAHPVVPDHLASLAVDLGILSSENPQLDQSDLEDLALADSLTSTISYLEHSLGIEREVIESESWNFDATVELIELTKKLDRIPFGGGTPALFDTVPSFESEALRSETSQGAKVRWGPRHHAQRTLFNLHPKDSMDAWLGKYPDPLERLRRPDHQVYTMDEVTARELPHLYGPGATHQCEYREKLAILLHCSLQDQSTNFITHVMKTVQTPRPEPIASGSGTQRTPSDSASAIRKQSPDLIRFADGGFSDDDIQPVPQSPEEGNSDRDDSDGLSYVDPEEHAVGERVDDLADEDTSDSSDSGSDAAPLLLDADMQTITFSTS